MPWEESIKQNIGIEIGLWGKLNFTVDLFDEKRNNILMTRNTRSSVWVKWWYCFSTR